MARLLVDGKTTATEDAYNSIMDLILNQQLRIGERTSVNLLAARLDVGLTPVKEAIIRLRSEGILAVAERSGTTVREVNGSEALQMFTVRHLLEDLASDAAAEHASLSQIKQVFDLLKMLRKLSADRLTRSSAHFVRANAAFHSAIVSASGNYFVSRLYDQMQIQAQIMTYLLHHRDDPAAASRRQREHEQIAEALRARNGKLLKQLLREHTKESEQHIKKKIPNPSSDRPSIRGQAIAS
jgi:DNA-binding GntR family transcriptional regulator